MNEVILTEKLLELVESVHRSSATPAEAKTDADGVYQSHPVGRSASLDEALSQLRVQLKYLLFDLEATRRENKYLRQMLENRYRPGKGDNLGQ